MTIEAFLDRLDRVRQRPRGWTARCPAHADRAPSLSISKGDDDRILVHCFSGCTAREICEALGMDLVDLFRDRHSQPPKARRPKQSRRDYRTEAGELELLALDLSLRGERVLAQANNLTLDQWTDDELDRALAAVVFAYADLARVDALQERAFQIRAAGIRNMGAQRERTHRAA